MHGALSIRASSILLLLLAISPRLATAETSVDEITTKDGSLLKGEIKRVEGGKLFLNTDYSDDVVIDVEHIVDIQSKKQFSVQLPSGEIISGSLTVSKEKIVLRESLLAAGADEVLQQALPAAENQLQQTSPDDRPRDGAMVAITESADAGPSEHSPAVERHGGRRFSLDDVDWIRETPIYLRYDAGLNVGVQLARGNTDTTDLHFDARFEPSFGWNTLRLSGHYDKKTTDGETTTNRWETSLVYERDFRRRWYVGARNTYESDAQQDVDLRIIFAAGVGYRFYDDDSTFFSVLPALAYVNENFEDASDDTDYVAFQLNTDFSKDLYKDDITLFSDNIYRNNLQRLSDISIETRTGLQFDMAWHLVLSAEFEADWRTEPAEGAKKLDTRYMLKIGFEFEGDENGWFQ